MPKVLSGSQPAADRELPPLPMPPLPMPPLPANPPVAWAAAPSPSAATVQQAYLARREEDLLARASEREKKAYEFLRQKLAALPNRNIFGYISAKEVKAAYDHINRAMQAADLTINFEASSWFARENPYDTYAQMYERAVGADGVMVLKNVGACNEPQYRAQVDNGLAFPQDWANDTGAQRRGLAPSRQNGARLMARMHTGDLAAVNPNDEKAGFRTTNARFNPRTKEVFAGLNFARREHGATFYYGYSFFILKPELKPQALYTPFDSFVTFDDGARADQVQFQYTHLASMLGAFSGNARIRGGGPLTTSIMNTCYHGRAHKDSCDPHTLIEAHIFNEVTFRNHVHAVVLSPKTTPRSDNTVPFSTIVANAKKFAAKHGIKLYQVS